MIVFGGWYSLCETCVTPLDDVWALPLSRGSVWTDLSPPGPRPGARYGAALVHDTVRDRLLLFGGCDAAQRLNDLWELPLAPGSAWNPLSPAGVPPSARLGAQAVFDPAGDRLLMFGGNDGSDRNDVWALSLGEAPTWTALAPAGAPPAGRNGLGVTYDPTRRRLLVIGGNVPDAYPLDLTGAPTWIQLVAHGNCGEARHQPFAHRDGFPCPRGDQSACRADLSALL